MRILLAAAVGLLAGVVVGGGSGGAIADPAADALDAAAGKALFERSWVPAPSSTRAADGLGPLFNARACSACHPAAGRGRPPDPPDAGGEPGAGFVLRLDGDPVYGRQVQTRGVSGVPPEARVGATYDEELVRLPGGGTVRLRRPGVVLSGLAYGPLEPGLGRSLRIAPPLRGLGLLAAVPETEILAAADPGDGDGDGISGRARLVAGPEGMRVGRFGWKAENASLEGQVGEAFLLDLGMSVPGLPAGWGDCTVAQVACRSAPHGAAVDSEGVEAPSVVLTLISRYLGDLPPRRGGEPDAAGLALFAATGCAACHRPALGTAPAAPGAEARRIFAFTDLLLHDMGPGLADGLAEGGGGQGGEEGASGSEWRTAPLWDLAGRGAQDGRLALLHDGRARSVAEAVLWHGGEAASARDRFAGLSRAERDRLVRFILSP
ncbi:di-heme oxidoredictase family protein [Arenibaculum pallidiluteum]|uniref:di-heme oxidoredictase family protein n=1 Tax=Arenibaculum pallidiluteum TaxID=2812559 RepID=UPI001A95F9DD|nr:di-heme oxidoredictase family protein [Arenibaculum pallidiluteum]